MARGGARSRSGPPKDPNSGRSDRIGFKLTALPSEGYRGDVPDLTAFIPDASPRHEAVWAQLWSTPQACAWSLEAWRWPIVADLAKWMVKSDAPDAPAALGSTIRQLRDDCGLSKRGLIDNGWAIAQDVVSAKREEKAEQPQVARKSSRDRLSVVSGGN